MKFGLPLIAFIVGVGVSWSIFNWPDRVKNGSIRGVELGDKKCTAEIKKMFGQETGEFVAQFKEMSIQIDEYPVNGCASPDGRFVIRLFGADEPVASDLWYPDGKGNIKELVRHYSFSCNGKTYSLDLGRSAENAKMTSILFSVTDAQGHYLSYMDSDADGRWDAFTDHTRKPPRIYRREGLTWKETPGGGNSGATESHDGN